MPKQLPYDDKYNETINFLKSKDSIVVATSDKDKVAARTVYFVMLNSCVYFLTSKAYDKYKQIVKNPNVALCSDNIQIQGVAKVKGHPGLEENKAILKYFLEKCPEKERNKRYVKHKNTVFIEVEINKISIWINGGREYIDLNEKTAYRIGWLLK